MESFDKALEEEAFRFVEDVQAAKKVADSVSKYTKELSPRELDFARRYAIEFRTAEQWARFYGVSQTTIYNWLNIKGVQDLIDEINYNFNTYFFHSHLVLMREAQQTYLKLMRLPMTEDTIETIRRSAHDITDFWKGIVSSEMGPPVPEKTAPDFGGNVVQVNVGVPGVQKEIVTEGNVTVDLVEVQRDLNELQSIQNAIDNYQRKKNGTELRIEDINGGTRAPEE